MKKGNHLIKDVTYFKDLRSTENKCNIPSNNVYFIYTIAQVDEKIKLKVSNPTLRGLHLISNDPLFLSLTDNYD